MKERRIKVFVVAGLLAGVLVSPQRARAHCDTMDGPVVKAAISALQAKDVTPVLKWVNAEREPEIKVAFKQALAVRTLSPEARALADRYFFETLVRVHRSGEGAPYTGLKPAGTEVEPIIAGADKALEKGSVEEIIKQVNTEMAAGIRKRFQEVQEKAQHASHNVAAGREYVAAYVEYVHYVEGLQKAAQGSMAHHEPLDSPLDSHQQK